MSRRNTRRHPIHLFLVAFALVLGGASLGLAPELLSGENFGKGGRGNNPVVGSLPCIVDENLDTIFGGVFGRPVPDETPIPPILGFVGPPLLGSSLVDAIGEPVGLINDPGSWNIFGLQNDALVTLSRFELQDGKTTLWQSLPDAFVGGVIRLDTPWGRQNVPITKNLVALPLTQMALQSHLYAQAAIRIEPASKHAGVGARNVVIAVTPAYVYVQHQP